MTFLAVEATPAHAEVGERLLPGGDFTTVVTQGIGMKVQVDPPSIAREYKWRLFLRTAGPSNGGRLMVRPISMISPVEDRAAQAFAHGRWTEYLPVSAVIVENTGGAVTVERIGVHVIHTEPQTPVGINHTRRFNRNTASLRLRELADVVGRLSLSPSRAVGSNAAPSDSTYCTVFLVRPDRVMTAAHCVDESLQDRAAEVVFGLIDGSGVEPEHMSVRLVAHSAALDVAILAIDPPRNNAPVVRFFEGEVRKPFKLAILHHVGGDPLSISDDSACEIVEDISPGPPTYDSAANKEITILDAGFKHGCDTAASSSGSPIVDREESLVIGMHRRGYRENEPAVNQGIRATYLREWMRDVLSK